MLLITRAEWGARPPRSTSTINPTDGVTLHYEGPAMGTFPHTSCASKVRGIQNFHMDDRGWADIAYNYVVCPHGYVFEGRKVDVRSAAQGTTSGNATSYAICGLWGAGDPLTDPARTAYLDARAYCRSHGRAGPNTRPHRYWHSTSCPGEPVAAWITAGCPAPGQTGEDDLAQVPQAEWDAVRDNVKRTHDRDKEVFDGLKTDGRFLPALFTQLDRIEERLTALENRP